MEHPTRSFVAELGRAVQSKLLFDVRLVCLDGFHAQVQFSCEPRRAETAPNQRENLQLAVAECFHLRARGLNLIGRETFQKAAHDACARIEMTFRDPLKRL